MFASDPSVRVLNRAYVRLRLIYSVSANIRLFSAMQKKSILFRVYKCTHKSGYNTKIAATAAAPKFGIGFFAYTHIIFIIAYQGHLRDIPFVNSHPFMIRVVIYTTPIGT